MSTFEKEPDWFRMMRSQQWRARLKSLVRGAGISLLIAAGIGSLFWLIGQFPDSNGAWQASIQQGMQALIAPLVLGTFLIFFSWIALIGYWIYGLLQRLAAIVEPMSA